MNYDKLSQDISSKSADILKTASVARTYAHDIFVDEITAYNFTSKARVLENLVIKALTTRSMENYRILLSSGNQITKEVNKMISIVETRKKRGV